MVNALRSAVVDIDGRRAELRELTTGDALTIWPKITAAERTGAVNDGYLDLIMAGCFDPDGKPFFASRDEIRDYPARITLPLAEKIMNLTEFEVGNVSADPNSTQPID